MNQIIVPRYRLCLSLFSLFAVTAQAAVETYRVHGTINRIDAANKKVTLAQDAVTELGWPVRTMTYKVDGDNVLTGVTARANCRCDFHHNITV